MHLHHVQVGMPPGQEDVARRFYRDALGLVEVDKPGELAGRGGCWFRALSGRQVTAEIHVGAMQPFVPARDAHLGLELPAGSDLHQVAERVRAAGFEVSWEERLSFAGYERFHCRDGFGNRVEVLSRIGDARAEIGDLRESMASLTSADLVDAMGRRHRHRCHILDLVSPTPGRVLVGPCVTISYFPTCDAIRSPEVYTFARLFYEAVGNDPAGRVLVLASNRHDDTSLGGGVKLSRVANNDMAGVLADARLRDFDELAEYDMATYCAGEATKWGGDVVTPFLANVPVVLRGVAVMPGDVVFADSAGAVVIPAGEVRAVVEEARRVNVEDGESLEAIRSEDRHSPHEP